MSARVQILNSEFPILDLKFRILTSSLHMTYVRGDSIVIVRTQVGFAELKETADDRVNIGSTIHRLIVGTIYINRSSGCRL